MIVGLVPARAGSERIRAKNTRDFNGKPMIGWVLDTMQQSGLFDRVIVSTDSQRVAQVARDFNAETPFLRPAELADNQIGLIPVIQHAINWLDLNQYEVTHLCCVLATAPLLHANYMRQAFIELNEQQSSFAFSVSRYAFPVQRAVRITSDNRVEAIHPEFKQTRSQDLEPRYHDAGQFYWGTREAFVRGDSMFSDHAIPIKLPAYLALDIDTPEDWRHAELVHQAMQLQNDA